MWPLLFRSGLMQKGAFMRFLRVHISEASDRRYHLRGDAVRQLGSRCRWHHLIFSSQRLTVYIVVLTSASEVNHQRAPLCAHCCARHVTRVTALGPGNSPAKEMPSFLSLNGWDKSGSRVRGACPNRTANKDRRRDVDSFTLELCFFFTCKNYFYSFIIFSLWENTATIKVTLLTVFKCTVLWR